MFSDNKGYYYQEAETELFERELPYRSVKIPLPHGRAQKILRQNQTKHEIDQLRLQILDRCKFEELEYLELLKRQRECMEEDIRRRKQQLQVQAFEGRIAQKKQQTKPKADSLDVFAKQEQNARARAKTQRVQSAYSNSLTSVSKSRVSSHKPVPQAEKVEQVVKKQQGVQQLKEELMEKYRFRGEEGKAPKKAAKDQTQVKWWVEKVRQHRQQQAKGKPISQQTVLSDTDSNDG